MPSSLRMYPSISSRSFHTLAHYPSFFVLLILLLIGSARAVAQDTQAPPGTRGGRPGGRPGAQAQGIGVISGALLDAETRSPVEYGNILLLRERDSSMVTGTITDAKGRFEFDNVTPGKYCVKARFIGYEDRTVCSLAITQQIVNVKTGQILIKAKSSNLGAVEVKADKPLIINNLEKKVIMVDKNMALSGGTAADVLQNVPSVAVDADGNVSLRGNPNITLLIDGKPASQAGISSSDILNQLPASSIESIEVITNPSVRYDPDGTSGILNIILKKKALQGFNGLVSATVGTHDKYNGSLNLNYRHDRLNLFSAIDGRLNHNLNESTSRRVTQTPSGQSTLLQNGKGVFDRNSFNGSVGADYTFDPRNNLTVSLQKRNMEFGNSGNDTSFLWMGEDLISRFYNRQSSSDRSIRSHGGSITYKHTFAEKGHEFTQDVVFNRNSMNNWQENNQFDFIPVNTSGNDTSQRQQNTAVNKNIMLSAQGNYIRPSAKGSRIEAGYKYSYRDMNMDYQYFLWDFDRKVFVEQPLLKNQYDYQEHIAAIYGIYSNSYRKLKYQGGLRLEQVLSASNVMHSAFHNNYFSYYPSAHLQCDLGMQRDVQLSYSRRVDRPSPREMNPYVDYSDSLNLRKGNPELKAEFTNSTELGYTQYWKKCSVVATLFWRNTNGNVEDISTLDSSGVSTTMPYNINRSDAYGIELTPTWNPRPWVRLMGNVSVYDYRVSAVPQFQIEQVDRLTWSGRLNGVFNYNKDGSFQLIANYMAPMQTAQMRMDGNFTVDASLRHDFFKSKLSLSARVTDIFNTRTFNSTTTGTNFIMSRDRKMDSRIFYFGVQYRLNNYNKKNDKDRQNSDNQDLDF